MSEEDQKRNEDSAIGLEDSAGNLPDDQEVEGVG